MAIELTDYEADKVALYLDRFATHHDAPMGPDEKAAIELARKIRERRVNDNGE